MLQYVNTSVTKSESITGSFGQTIDSFILNPSWQQGFVVVTANSDPDNTQFDVLITPGLVSGTGAGFFIGPIGGGYTAYTSNLLFCNSQSVVVRGYDDEFGSTSRIGVYFISALSRSVHYATLRQTFIGANTTSFAITGAENRLKTTLLYGVTSTGDFAFYNTLTGSIHLTGSVTSSEDIDGFTTIISSPTTGSFSMSLWPRSSLSTGSGFDTLAYINFFSTVSQSNQFLFRNEAAELFALSGSPATGTRNLQYREQSRFQSQFIGGNRNLVLLAGRFVFLPIQQATQISPSGDGWDYPLEGQGFRSGSTNQLFPKLKR